MSSSRKAVPSRPWFGTPGPLLAAGGRCLCQPIAVRPQPRENLIQPRLPIIPRRLSTSASSTTSSPPPVAAPRLSIVVLPFANLSNDPEQQYFADGITEDLTTDLSRISDMVVISRNTAFTYRDQAVVTSQIGRELSVRYVLEGSVRRSGHVVRVNAQLIEAETDAHLWAERFDGDAGDLFAMQNTITRRIAGAVDAKLITAEAKRPVEHPDALDYILRGRSAYNQWPIRDNYAHAVSLFEQALALNPQSVEAQTWIAHVLATRVLRRQTDARAADIERAQELIEQALDASPRSAHAHFVKGQVLRTQYRFADAIPEYETVIASDLNYAGAYANLGLCKFVTGSVEELIPLHTRALGLDPDDPFVGTVHSRMGFAYLLHSHYDDAVVAFQEACLGRPAGVTDFHSFLAAVYALQGKSERAASELAQARKLASDNRYSSITRVSDVPFGGIPNQLLARGCSKPPTSPACARPGCRRSDRHPRGIGIARTRHIRRSCALSSLTSSAAHSRASSIFPASRKARAFARARVQPRIAFPALRLGRSGRRMTWCALLCPMFQRATDLDPLMPSRLASRRGPPAASRTADPLRAIRPRAARCGSRNALSDAAKRCHPACQLGREPPLSLPARASSRSRSTCCNPGRPTG